METNGNGTPEGYERPRPRIARGGVPELADQTDRDIVKDALRPSLLTWCQNVIAGVEKNERNAMNNYARAMGLAGAEVEINIGLMLTKELGVASIAEARRKLAMVESVQDIDEDAAMSVIEQHLRTWYAARGMRVVIMADDAKELPA